MSAQGGAHAFVFQDYDFGTGHVGGAGSIALGQSRAIAALPDRRSWRERIRDWAIDVDLTPDLGHNIGSLHWWRGLATCTALCGTMLALAPGVTPVPGAPSSHLPQAQFEQYRSQMITPLALGADSGQHMGPTEAVAPLTHTPERPYIDLDAVIGVGDNFGHVLQRAGVSSVDSDRVMALIRSAADPDAIEDGTLVRITLGRRSSANMPRPLDALSVRARLDLALEIRRRDGVLDLREIPIAVDNTPLHIQGSVGSSLYAAARAAGADPTTIQSYLKVIAQQLSLESDVTANDRFDIVVEHHQAATGERETGRLLFAGLERGRGKSVNMLLWKQGDKAQWFEASGVGESRGQMSQPVAGHLTSGFGMRFHPILGYSRMHQGVDFGAAWGAPIYAAAAGRVVFAGPHGGHGNFVKLDNGGGYATGYGHMSRIAASTGEYVRRGEVIGYVGSTGLSTGPHLHFEVYRNGAPVNPLGVKFIHQAQLTGSQLAAFKSQLARYKSLPVGIQAPSFAARVASDTSAE